MQPDAGCDGSRHKGVGNVWTIERCHLIQYTVEQAHYKPLGEYPLGTQYFLKGFPAARAAARGDGSPPTF